MKNLMVFVLGLIALVVGAVELTLTVVGKMEQQYFVWWLLVFTAGVLLLTLNTTRLHMRSEW